jgi:hypothetical protein
VNPVLAARRFEGQRGQHGRDEGRRTQYAAHRANLCAPSRELPLRLRCGVRDGNASMVVFSAADAEDEHYEEADDARPQANPCRNSLSPRPSRLRRRLMSADGAFSATATRDDPIRVHPLTAFSSAPTPAHFLTAAEPFPSPRKTLVVSGLTNICLFSYCHTIHILSLGCTSCSFVYTRQPVLLILAQNRCIPDDYRRVFAENWVRLVYCQQ